MKDEKRTRLSREERKQQTHERLLQAAHRLFARKGYEGTAMDEIAEEAGFSRGAFYAHFGSKEAIMRELIAGGFESDIEAIRSMPTDSIDAVAAGYGTMARAFYENPDNTLWMLEFQLAAVRHPELRKDYAAQYDRLRQAVSELVARTDLPGKDGREVAGEVAGDHSRFADIFLVMLSGLSLIKLIDPEAVDSGLFEDGFRALVDGMQSY